MANPSNKLTQEEVRRRFRERDVELAGTYINSQSATPVICIVCGRKWNGKPGNIFQGHGCPDCGRVKTGNAKRLKEDALQNRLIELGRRGIVMVGKYTVNRNKTLFRCTCGHEWCATPRHVFRGRGCSACAIPGFRSDKPGTLYYIRLSDHFGDSVYKIGITNLTVRARFGKEFSKINIIETWHFANGGEALEMEQDILKDYDADRYTGFDLLESGNDELFNRDVLGLDRGIGQLGLVA